MEFQNWVKSDWLLIFSSISLRSQHNIAHSKTAVLLCAKFCQDRINILNPHQHPHPPTHPPTPGFVLCIVLCCIMYFIDCICHAFYCSCECIQDTSFDIWLASLTEQLARFKGSNIATPGWDRVRKQDSRQCYIIGWLHLFLATSSFLLSSQHKFASCI